MRQYELVVVLPSEDELFRQGKESVLADIAKFGAAEIREEDMGDRPLAYPIGKKERGHYMLYRLGLDQTQIVPMERAFKLNTGILKYLLVKAEA